MNRTQRLRLVLFYCALIVLAQSCASLKQSSLPAMQNGSHTLQHGTYQRSYYLHVPPSLPPNQPLSLVLVFHGGGGQGKGMEGISGFSALADKQGFIVAYPDGVGHRWRTYPEATPEHKAVDDVGFTSALIDQLSQMFQIAPERIYAAGISNGAAFSFRLACELSSRIAAIGTVAGALSGLEASHCKPDHAVAVIDFHGTADPIIRYDGGVVRGAENAEPLLSTPDTITHWRQIDGCPSVDQRVALPHSTSADTTSVEEQASEACKGGTAVVAYTINDGGHTWPGGPQYLPVVLIGKTNRDIMATDLIWDFFRRHPR